MLFDEVYFVLIVGEILKKLIGWGDHDWIVECIVCIIPQFTRLACVLPPFRSI